MTLHIGMTLTGILVAVAGIWIIVRQASANIPYRAESRRRVAEIAERIEARLRYPDIDNNLRESIELLEGCYNIHR